MTGMQLVMVTESDLAQSHPSSLNMDEDTCSDVKPTREHTHVSEGGKILLSWIDSM